MSFDFRAFLEADDEEEKKKKSEEDDDEDLDDSDDDKKDDDDDDSSTDNDYLGDDDKETEFGDDEDLGSSNSDDSSTDNDYLGDSEDGVGGIEGDDYSSSSGDDSGSMSGDVYDKLTKVVYATVVAINNLRHIHFHCSGPQFKDIHQMTDNMYSNFIWSLDELAELALQGKGVKLDNLCNAHQYVSEMDVETEDNYDFTAACTACASIFRILKSVYKDARDAVGERSDIQSRLDDKLGFINKQLNYSLERRLSGSSDVPVDESCSFFNFNVK